MNINLWHLDIALYLLMDALQCSKKRLKRKIMPLNTMPHTMAHTMAQTFRKSPTWGSKGLSLSYENVTAVSSPVWTNFTVRTA